MTIEKANEILAKYLPESAYRQVWQRAQYDKSTALCICIAASDHKINNVKGQLPLCVTLWVKDGVLTPQIFGGWGGQWIYFKKDPNNPKERYYALKRVGIPFRKGKPAANEKQLARFCVRWVEAIKANAEFIRREYPAPYEDILNFNPPKVG